MAIVEVSAVSVRSAEGSTAYAGMADAVQPPTTSAAAAEHARIAASPVTRTIPPPAR
jgi:hypothetical protein